LIRSGKIIRPGLGVELAEEQIAKKIGVDGVLMVEVMSGGSGGQSGNQADAAGELRMGHSRRCNYSIEGKKVESPNDLFLILENYQVGDAVTVALLRDGKIVQTKYPRSNSVAQFQYVCRNHPAALLYRLSARAAEAIWFSSRS
jgi:S1-C subfamily serine protease